MTDAQTDREIKDGLRELQRQGDPIVARHTKLPWMICTYPNDPRHGLGIVARNGAVVIADLWHGGCDTADAAFIMLACNAHDELVAALTFALAHVEELRDAWSRGAISEHDSFTGGTRSNRNVDVEVRIRAALAKAGQP